MTDVLEDATGTVCRLRLVVGERTLDLAVPGEVALVDLLPAVLRHAGGRLADESVDHDGWVLQRLGQPALDEERTPAQLGLVDGEVLHLRPRADALPAIDVDDVVAGIAEQVRGRTDRWRAVHTRALLLAAAVLVLAGCAALLQVSGTPTVRVAVQGGLALVLLVAAAALSRGRGDTLAGTVLAAAAVVLAAGAAGLAPVLADDGASLGTRLACAGAGALVALALGVAGVADGALLFVGGLLAVALVTAAAAIDVLSSADGAEAAAIVLVVAMLLTTFVPITAFRFCGLSLPLLPTSAEEFQTDLDPVPQQVVVDRAAVADAYMTALYAALAVAEVVLVVPLLRSAAGWELVLLVLTGVVLLLRSRHVAGAWQRSMFLVPAATCLLGATLVRLSGATEFQRLTAGVGTGLGLVLLLVALSIVLPDRRLRPYWGRAADLLESITAVALVPVLLALLGVYARVRGLNG